MENPPQYTEPPAWPLRALAELFNFEGAEKESGRLAYLTILSGVAKSLPTEDLIVATDLIKMLAMARPFAKGKFP